jgi:hypothetical protein
MPFVDNDLVTVRSASRGAGKIELLIQWTDGQTGEDKGSHGVSFNNKDELIEFLNGQTFEDIVRAVLGQVINRIDGSLRPTVFDGLAGKTFRIQQRVQQVT